MQVEREHEKVYTKQYYCNNCGHTFTAVFDFGEVAHQPACPKCGVSPGQLNRPTLIKEWMGDRYFLHSPIVIKTIVPPSKRSGTPLPFSEQWFFQKNEAK